MVTQDIKIGAKKQTAYNYLDIALDYHRAGLRVIPVNEDKKPTCKWKPFQKAQSEEDVRRIFKTPSWGIAIVTGIDLEVLDIDQKNWKYDSNLMDDYMKHSGIRNQDKCPLSIPVIQSTKNGGYHVIYKCDTIEGNQDLAKNEDKEVILETRGSGGYIVAHPSPGYELQSGSFTAIPKISVDQRKMILDTAKELDQTPVQAPKKINARVNKDFEGKHVWEAYNESNSVLDILTSKGWKEVNTVGRKTFLLRPGDSSAPYSGNYHDRHEIFVCHSSSTKFEAGRPYDAIGVYTVLEHNGDQSAAASALYKMGYGDRQNGNKAPENSAQQNKPAPEPDKLLQHVKNIAIERRKSIGQNGGLKDTQSAIEATRKYLKEVDKLEGPQVDQAINEVFKMDLSELKEDTQHDELAEIKAEFFKLYDYRKNTVTEKPEYKEKYSNEWQEITDYKFNSIFLKLKSKGVKNVSEQILKALINSYVVPEVDPIIEYFKSLKWDKKDHIEKLCNTVDHAGANEAESKAMFKKYLTKWLVASIANAHNKRDCENQQVFILQGPQGSGKSTWLKNICPPPLLDTYYIESDVDPTNTDDQIATAENFIYNLDDHLADTTPKKINALKSFITQNTVKKRGAYGKFTLNRPKIANFLASTNEGQFLHDKTGNRRWMPFRISYIYWEAEVDINQVWAQAMELYRSGKFPYKMSRADMIEINKHNSQFEVQSTEYEMVTTYFRVPDATDETTAFLTNSEIRKRIQEHNEKVRLSEKKMGEALNQLGFDRVRKSRNGKRVWGYEVIIEHGKTEEEES